MLRVVLLALLVRVIYILQLRASPWFDTPTMDAAFHDAWARTWADGRTFWPGPYFRAPLYPWFLGGIYWLLGPDPLVTRLVQAALGSANCALLYLIGRHTFGRFAGILAGLAAATYWVFVYFDAELLSPVLIVFLNLLLIGGLLLARARRRAWLWLTCGVLLGLSVITRPDILLVLPAFVAWSLVGAGRPLRRRAAHAACLVGGCAAMILPVTLRNITVGGDFVLVASSGGVNLYIGNNPGADGMTAVIPGDPYEWWPCCQAQVQRAETAAGRELRPSEVSRWYTRQTWAYVKDHPVEALGRMARKLGYFWSHWEIPNNQDIHFIVSTYTPIVHWLPLGFWLVGPLGLVGLVLSLRRAGELLPLWGLVLTYMLVVTLFFANARYRLPAVAVLILLATHAVVWFGHALRERRWRHLAGAAAVLALIAPLVARVPPNVDTLGVQGHHYAGLTLAEQGRFADAEHMLLTSLSRARQAGWPTHPMTWHALGVVRLKLHKPQLAGECFEQTLALDPDFPTARENLALVLGLQGRFDEAITQYESLLARDPDNAHLRAQLGNALVGAGRIDQGRDHLVRAILSDPAQEAALRDTLIALLNQQRYGDARRLLDDTRCPSTAPLQTLATMLAALAECPDDPDVVRSIEQWMEQDRPPPTP